MPSQTGSLVASSVICTDSSWSVVVVPLWLNHYRANVLVGPDPTAVRTAHSYFVTADDAGRILTSAPPLTRLYP